LGFIRTLSSAFLPFWGKIRSIASEKGENSKGDRSSLDTGVNIGKKSLRLI
jgi:hypothetical protein